MMKTQLKKIGEFSVGLLLLFTFFFVGNGIAGLLPFSIPGSVIGMILIFTALSLKIIKLKWIEAASMVLLGLMGLFFVPYGVGIIDAWYLVESWGLYIILIAVLTSVATFAISGTLFKLLKKR